MPYPTGQQLTTLRPELATFEQLDREMQSRGYVATRLLPPFEVSVASATFGVIKLKSLLANANADTKRTSTGGYNRGDYEFEDRSYKTQEHGWEEPVDHREENMYGSFFELEEIATYRAWEHVLSTLEARTLAQVLTATVAAGYTAAATALWSSYSTSKPIDDVYAAQDAIWLRTGIWPNTVAMSRRTYRHLRRSAQVIAEIQSGGAGNSTVQTYVTQEMLADVLGVDRIVVADSIKNTANIGQDAVIASMFPETQIVVCRTATTNDFKEPCIGRIFHWGGDGSVIQGSDENPLIGVVEEYEEPQTRKTVIRARHETAEFILYPQAAQVVTGIQA